MTLVKRRAARLGFQAWHGLFAERLPPSRAPGRSAPLRGVPLPPLRKTVKNPRFSFFRILLCANGLRHFRPFQMSNLFIRFRPRPVIALLISLRLCQPPQLALARSD